MRMSELLNEVRRFELDEGFSPREIKMAIGIASDPRYAKGNMTGAVNAIEKMKKGLSKHPQVMAVLKRQNEDVDLDEAKMTTDITNDKKIFKDIEKMGVKVKNITPLSGNEKNSATITMVGTKNNINKVVDKYQMKHMMGVQDFDEDIDEAVSPAQQAAIAISKKERGEKPKEEGNAFGKELKAARDKGEKTFVVSGKKYNVEDYDVKEEITEKFSDGMIDKLRKAYEPLRGKKIPPGPLMKIFDKIDSNKAGLEQLYKADIPFVSVMAMSRLMLRHNYKATDINKLGKINMEEFELDEEISINELKMNDPKLIKVFDKLKAKDTVKIKSSSTISQGKDFIEYQVKTKNTLRNGVEKITLMLKGNPTGKNRFLYKKDGKVTFAIGDLGASIDDIKEMAYKPGSFKDTRPQEKTAKALDDLIMKGGLDKNDFRQARILYVQTSDPKSRKKLRDFIQDLDTSPAEAVMDAIGRNDPDTFEKMYPDAKSGEFLSKISFRHRKIKNEEVELDEKYDLYHKSFSDAMQHAYSYAKSKMGITVDPKEIDSKVATGPKKPTEGKTNKYMLKGKGGNLQIQVYNKGGSKPFELNMYKEENNLIAAAVGHLSND
jgi:hypothetical protein